MSAPRTFPPVAAALSFLLYPGLGHFYADRVARAIAVFFAYILLTQVLLPLGPLAFVLFPVLRGLIAYDAWRVAEARALEETNEVPPAEPAPVLLRALWVLLRAPWTVLLPGTVGLMALYGVSLNIVKGTVMDALIALATAVVTLPLAGWAVWRLWRVGTGREPAYGDALRRDLLQLSFLYGFAVFLGLVFVPKLLELIRYSSDGANKGNLGALRNAVSVYKAEHREIPPATPEELLASANLKEPPPLWGHRFSVPHPRTRRIVGLAAPVAADTGAWAYASDGTIFIDCTHTDTKGAVWSSY